MGLDNTTIDEDRLLNKIENENVIVSLMDIINRFDSEITDLKNQLEEEKKKSSDLEDSLSDRYAEIQGFKDEIKELNVETDNLKDEINNFKSQRE